MGFKLIITLNFQYYELTWTLNSRISRIWPDPVTSLFFSQMGSDPDSVLTRHCRFGWPAPWPLARAFTWLWSTRLSLPGMIRTRFGNGCSSLLAGDFATPRLLREKNTQAKWVARKACELGCWGSGRGGSDLCYSDSGTDCRIRHISECRTR